MRYVVVLTLVCAVAGVASAEDNVNEVFDSLYGDQLRRVTQSRDQADDVDLAKQLIESAPSAAEQPALAGLMCEHAYKLSSGVRTGYDTAVTALQQWEKHLPAKAEFCLRNIYNLRSRQYNMAGGNTAKRAAGERLIGATLGFADHFEKTKDTTNQVAQLRRAGRAAD